MKTPVTIIIFNRPDLTKKMLTELREYSPTHLLVIADGPRNSEEARLCDETRKVVSSCVDWECRIEWNSSEVNLGLEVRVETGLDWVFDKVDRAIVVEDDCCLARSFFLFCDELLDRYESNEKVLAITASNFQDGKKWGEGDYYFSRYPHCWGWATWRRAWDLYDSEMSDLDQVIEREALREVLDRERPYRGWIKKFRAAKKGVLNSWATKWTYACMKHGGLVVTPQENLVTNIGFDSRATHTKNANSKNGFMNSSQVEFPLTHPKAVKRQCHADSYVERRNFRSSFLSRFKRLIRTK